MDLYGGMDRHGDNVFCTVMDPEHRPVFERRLPNDLAALEPYRKRLKAVAVESTYSWCWPAAFPHARGQERVRSADRG
jgi:hypothetical protein